MRRKDALLRFVVAPSGEVVFDAAQNLPGRGLWLLPRRDMLEKAARRKLFQRAAKAPVEIPADLAARVEAQLRARALDLLGLARRSGQAVAGMDKVRVWLKDGRAGLLMEAVDGAEDGHRKVIALARATVPDAPVVRQFDAAELGAALGRADAVHVAVARGRFAERLAAAAVELAEFEEEGPATVP